MTAFFIYIIMKYRALGNSGFNVSEIGFGCMSLKVDARDNEYLLRSAVDQGVNFFDTADLYDQGENERLVGSALSPVRDQIYLATKVGNRWKADGSGWEWAASKAYILEAVNKSLTRLQTDYIDLYQLHGGTLEDPIDEIIEAFELLKKQGKIRSYGISSIRPNVIREYVSKSHISSTMMQYSLLDRRPEEACLSLLEESDIGVLARGSLAKGLLIDKPAKEYLGYSENDIIALQHAIKDSINPISIALHFVLNSSSISSSLLGIRTKDQLDSIVKAYHQDVTPNEITSAMEVLLPNVYTQHR